ncbi:MAG: HupE/UreJ family protein [Proteobacteria bacterium]|nr:HupE/UreJ family protein [Pseudomonadota bacterium]
MLGADPAAAHPLDLGYLKVEATAGEVTIVFDLEAGVATRLAGGADPEMLANASYRLAAITTNAGPCTWTTTTAALRAATNTMSLTGHATCPAGASTLRWALPVIARLPSTFEVLVKARAFGGDHVTMLRHDATVLELTGRSSAVSLGALVKTGVEHIGAWPNQWRDADGWKLADGIDHILFLLALLLGGGTLLGLFGIATGFTLGHSVTLALAALGIVRIPPSVIEPLVALTIVATAVEAYLGRWRQHRWKIATAFGFIHGFAFASALRELDLASTGIAKTLLGFNVGVELGQAMLIAILAPLIIALHRCRPRAGRIVVRVLAVAIGIAGMYWFVRRTIG